MNIDHFTEEHTRKFLELCSGKSAVIMLYCPNTLVNGKLVRISSDEEEVTPIAIGGVTYLPAFYFEKFLKVLPKVLNELGIPSAVRKGQSYLPAISVCEALSIRAKSFYDGRMTVIAEESVIEALDKDNQLVYAGSYEMYEKYDPEKFTHEDYVKAKDSYRKRLVGCPEKNDISSLELKEKLDAIDIQCEKMRETMNRGEGIPKLWGDEPPVESNELRTQYGGILSLAKAFGTYGCKYYHSEEVKQDILFGLQWMFENMYGDAELEGRSKWRSKDIFNWWDWYVGAPEILMDTLLIMENYLTPKKIADYLKLFVYVVDNTRLGDDNAQGRSRVGAKAALLLEEPKRLARAYRDYDIMLGIVDEGHGLHRDFAHYWHNFPYNLMYGLSGLLRILTVSSSIKGTPLEFRSPREYNQFLSAKYMLEAAIHNGRGFSVFNGRGNYGSESSNGLNAVIGLLPLIGLFGEDEDRHLKKLVKRSCATEALREMAFRICSLPELSLLKSIFDDETISYESDYELGYVWYTGDRAAQHRKKYSIALAVCSEREPSYESINSANKFGWYTGDGALYLYTDHDREAFDGANFYSNRNIGYRIPGTTVDDQKRIAKSISRGWYTSRSFAGGVSVDDKYVIEGFDYESFHFEGPDSGTDDSGYGGGLNIHHNDLVAKKAWFMFDNECVCLGAGISSTTGANVNTILEHRRLVKRDGELLGTEDVRVDGSLMPKCAYSEHITSPKWINVEGTSGYYFPKECNVYISKYFNTDAPKENDYAEYVKCYDPNKPFFEIRIEHGKCPDNAAYEYVMLPMATDDEVMAYSKDPDVEIISNTARLQAVREKTLGITGMVFHEAGECEGICVSAPCILAYKESDGKAYLRVSDPTHKLEKITVTVDKPLTPKEQDGNVNITAGDKIVLDISIGGLHGAPVSVTFNK